jgi:DNA-binding MarR family transcriptional regulator
MELTVLTATANASTPPTVARIGRSLGHPRQVVQRAANRLVELGLIRLEPNPDHKRAPLLLATERGEATKAADGARARAASDAMLARVGAEEFANATEALRTIRREIETYLRERMA